MATKFKVLEIYDSGSFNDAIIRMVTNNNRGAADATLELMVAHCKAQYAQFPTITPVLGWCIDEESRTLHLKEGDKKTLVIQEIEVEPLDIKPDSQIEAEIREETENDLRHVNI